jgi:hypothetical protein
MFCSGEKSLSQMRGVRHRVVTEQQDALVRACDKWLFAGLSAHGAALHEK